MKTILTGFRRSLPLLVLVPLLWLGDALAAPSNKWRIEISGGARSNGVIVLRVAPTGGVTNDVQILVPRTANENHVAQLIRDGLYAGLGDGYRVEGDDGEDVLVKRRYPTPYFDLILVNNSVEGVSMRLQAE